jgi:ribonuclease HII
MTTWNLGIDDAGRGPVIGPMILAGVLLDEKEEKYLKSIGVKDSKAITQKRREFLEEKIKEKAETFEITLTFPDEIENQNINGVKLNEVEAIECAKIINKINKENSEINVILDCPSPSLVKWADYLKIHIKNLSNLEISCEHKADRNHVSVAAASILAKCMREREMKKLKEKYGNEIGSGYTSDPLTQKFLTKYAHKYRNEGIFRKTWITWKKAVKVLEQEKLDF